MKSHHHNQGIRPLNPQPSKDRGTLTTPTRSNSPGDGAITQPAPAQRRDQRWALYAYTEVGQIKDEDRKAYKIAVNDLGSHILRSGLSASLAGLQRKGKPGGALLLGHLAGARLAGLDGVSKEDLVAEVNKLNVDSYMITTRETLQLVSWLKRAVQATFEGE